MTTQRQDDYPGAWWHITNRGLSQRTIFENRHDVARFEEILTDVCERGLLEVHALSCIPNHFHLQTRSTEGRISEALRLIENFYSRWFNRARKRDGALFRGRFRRKRIDDAVYWETALRYIDLNPVRARLCDRPSEYAHGSARAYALGESRPYLMRGHVERAVRAWLGRREITPDDYDHYSLVVDPDLVAHIVERGLRFPRGAPAGHFDDLVRIANLEE